MACPKCTKSTEGEFLPIDRLVRNGLDTIQVTGHIAHRLARRVDVSALGCKLQGGADVSDGLESIGSSGAPHLVPQHRHGLKVSSIQSVKHRDDILPAVLQLSLIHISEP